MDDENNFLFTWSFEKLRRGDSVVIKIKYMRINGKAGHIESAAKNLWLWLCSFSIHFSVVSSKMMERAEGNDSVLYPIFPRNNG